MASGQDDNQKIMRLIAKQREDLMSVLDSMLTQHQSSLEKLLSTVDSSVMLPNQISDTADHRLLRATMPVKQAFSSSMSVPSPATTPMRQSSPQAKLAVQRTSSGLECLESILSMNTDSGPAASPLPGSVPFKDGHHARASQASVVSAVDNIITSRRNTSRMIFDGIRYDVSQRSDFSEDLLSALSPTEPEVEDAKSNSLFSRVRATCTAIVKRKEFDVSMFCIVLSNILLVGLETHLATAGASSSVFTAIKIVDEIYTAIFTFELSIRVIVDGWKFIYCGHWKWNLLDVFIVMSSLLTMILDLFEASSDGGASNQFRIVRVLRITRLLRTFRIVRVVRFLIALRKLIHSIAVTLKAVGWAFVLMVLIFYAFGVLFTQAVNDHLEDACSMADACDDVGLRLYWGSLETSMLTLYKCSTNGLDWNDAVTPLTEIGWIWKWVFMAFVAFMYFAVLNVLTGMFCQSAIESTQMDKDLACMHQLANKEQHVSAMTQLFEEIDSDQSGSLTLETLRMSLQQERTQAYFSTLEIDASDAWTLFKLLDTEGQGCIQLDEFVTGCLSLRGQAKAVHVAEIVHETKCNRRVIQDKFRVIKDELDAILTALGNDHGKVGLKASARSSASSMKPPPCERTPLHIDH
eukprot:TRINITY_DN72203_c0_g1_i1.p1 TRINITY_DN72203_c0_g1~~TRINITY_DN72203_c0_g1_i1.p1  ORF type:complete len:635 (+),score=78.68 TRINITY_DN72203_c0_g1_i1:60-1964(+)